MREKREFKSWIELSDSQKEEVLSKLSKELGKEYIMRPGMKYVINAQGEATGKYEDPYLLSGIFY